MVGYAMIFLIVGFITCLIFLRLRDRDLERKKWVRVLLAELEEMLDRGLPGDHSYFRNTEDSGLYAILTPKRKHMSRQAWTTRDFKDLFGDNREFMPASHLPPWKPG